MKKFLIITSFIILVLSPIFADNLYQRKCVLKTGHTTGLYPDGFDGLKVIGNSKVTYHPVVSGIRKIENNLWELRITYPTTAGIADVCFYVKPGDILELTWKSDNVRDPQEPTSYTVKSVSWNEIVLESNT